MSNNTKMIKNKQIKKIIYNEKYHENCHDYLKKVYLEKYAEKKYKPFLYQLKEKIQKINICNEIAYAKYGKIIVCDQHAVVFGHHLDKYPILATYALNACVGLVLYLPEFKIGCLAHIDGLPGYSRTSAIGDGIDIKFDPVKENVKHMLRYLRKLCNSDKKILINYYLIGGIFGMSEVMIYDIIECINGMTEHNFYFNFKARNVLGPENQTRNICIDMCDGKIYYFDYVTNFEYYSSNPTNIIKAPRLSDALLDVTYVATTPIFNGLNKK